MVGESVRGPGALDVPREVWEVAVARARVIGPLAVADRLGAAAVESAAVELGLSRRHVYALVARWRAGRGVVSDLLPGRSSGGRGREQLAEPVEAVIREVLRRRYVDRQRRSVAVVHREIERICRTRGLAVPSRGSVVRRIAKLDPVVTTRQREGVDAARSRQGAGGAPPAVTRPLEQVQIDHTVVDVVIVDETHRLPIGRPYVTVAVDVFSRAVVGLVVTLEAPSALSVGLCLAHMVTDKRAWLEGLGVQAEWVMSGKPEQLYVDNAAEFKSEALRRGCEQHGIAVSYRPPGRPHYGGIVERLIGTMMRTVHELPGTTFSNPAQRGGYDADAAACLTLTELQRWLALAVCSYHQTVHRGISQAPAARWAGGLEAAGAGGLPVTVQHEAGFLLDFLPVERRRLTRTGFVLDHVHYYCDALRPWIARREQLDRFVVRRDPRDISRIWVLDPDDGAYLPVPYRTMSNPPLTLWEHRAAVAALRTAGRAEVDEAAVFAMVAQMRAITDTAQTTTRRARRDSTRRAMAGTVAGTPAGTLAGTPAGADSTPPAMPTPPGLPGFAGAAAFEVIEQW
ncbi:MAG TPA: Mu transposase C-terminal domain-containing protein [Streptomyces sp.]|uniref:Mu transposase C-terminal domain-containing protein n=1 Tax=Streptomyces sp. TaxID=1931 RepID=UPI002D342B8E|nr:Mu transposase C-terminal domain-containing protein [Streptomyces sp.]HZG06650.1 Mu transposase C-terminal domain-containing protein [Streptomyces sp.]